MFNKVKTEVFLAKKPFQDYSVAALRSYGFWQGLDWFLHRVISSNFDTP